MRFKIVFTILLIFALLTGCKTVANKKPLQKTNNAKQAQKGNSFFDNDSSGSFFGSSKSGGSNKSFFPKFNFKPNFKSISLDGFFRGTKAVIDDASFGIHKMSLAFTKNLSIAYNKVVIFFKEQGYKISNSSAGKWVKNFFGIKETKAPVQVNKTPVKKKFIFKDNKKK